MLEFAGGVLLEILGSATVVVGGATNEGLLVLFIDMNSGADAGFAATSGVGS